MERCTCLDDALPSSRGTAKRRVLNVHGLRGRGGGPGRQLGRKPLLLPALQLLEPLDPARLPPPPHDDHYYHGDQGGEEDQTPAPRRQVIPERELAVQERLPKGPAGVVVAAATGRNVAAIGGPVAAIFAAIARWIYGSRRCW